MGAPDPAFGTWDALHRTDGGIRYDHSKIKGFPRPQNQNLGNPAWNKENRVTFLQKLFGPSTQEIWRQLCAEIGAQYVEGGFWKGDKVQAAHGPWTITLDTYTVSNGKTSITYTRMRAPFV